MPLSKNKLKLISLQMSLMDNMQQKTKHTFKLAQCLVEVLYISN